MPFLRQCGRVQLKCDGTRWLAGGGGWRGYWRMEWVASTLRTTSEHTVSSITTAGAHTSAACSRLNWRPRRFKWTRPFHRKTKCGFCACAITFQSSLQLGTARPATDGNIIRRMRIACWITEPTDKHSEYVILIAFPLQQWLRERASLLRYTYIAFLLLL
jgi:hypothetical protein